MLRSVKIGPSFFAKEFNEYADWRWAYARESMQNCLDAAGSTRVLINVIPDGEHTQVSFQNNGEPMTEEVLVDKLLAIGETGKGFQGTAGGFGKAKLLLLFCHNSWSVRTGTLLAEGIGGEYRLTRELPEFHGTLTTVQVKGNEVQELVGAFRKFIAYAQTEITFVLNGEELCGHLRKGHPRREFEYGTVYTNNSFPRLLICRIDGNPMFTRRIDWDKCVVVELKGASDKVLTSNRDGLRYSYREELDKFILQLAVDKKSALRKQKAEYKRFQGEQLKNEARRPVAVTGLDVREMLGLSPEREQEQRAEQHQPDYNDLRVAANLVANAPVGGAGIQVETVARSECSVSIGPNFILKNTTGMVTPDYYQPGDQFGSYGLKLARMWARLLLELHKLMDHSAEFSIGFLLDEDSKAEHETSPEYGEVYYLNPAMLVAQKNKPQCRSFRKRWSLNDGYEILSVAAHELVHGMGYGPHDENYASKLTEVFGVVARNVKRFTPLFRESSA